MEVNSKNISYYNIVPVDHRVVSEHLGKTTERAFILQFADSEMRVTSENSHMHVYKEEIYGTHYDHLRVKNEDGSITLVRMTEELSDLLFEEEFPYYWRKQPEEEVYRELGIMALENME